jgi:DNA-binding NarL/FixJ family response regulator
MAITIVIADDHDIIREGIKNILLKYPYYRVVGEAVDGEQALEVVESVKPRILLLDISMPRVSGLDIISRIKHICPQTDIIIVTVHKSDAYIRKAFKAGVKGYLHKGNTAEELLPALRRVLSGGVYLSFAVSEYLAEKISRHGLAAVLEEEGLNQREKDILRLVAEGKTAREIGEVLFLSPRTVENYKNNLLKKLSLHKTSDLIKYAIENKIVEI